MKCELLSEHNLALMLDFIDDENTKYDESVLKAFLEESAMLLPMILCLRSSDWIYVNRGPIFPAMVMKS